MSAYDVRSCQAIFTDVLGMNRVAAKIVPKFLSIVRLTFLSAKNKLTMQNG